MLLWGQPPSAAQSSPVRPVRHATVHNKNVPFTLSHAAAALPFRRCRLGTSALVIGTFAPDFEYFLHLTPEDRFGHTLRGTFVLTLPLALAVLWLFHRFVKATVARLLPESIERRLQPNLGNFRFGGPARFLLVLLSLLLGIATHLLWDSFTPRNTWLYKRWSFLRQPIRLPIFAMTPCYKVLQHGSTIAGLAVLAVCFIWWYRSSPPWSQNPNPYPRLTTAQKLAIVTTLTAIASAAAIVRAVVGSESSHLVLENFVAQAVVTVIALMWWELVIYGLFLSANEIRLKP